VVVIHVCFCCWVGLMGSGSFGIVDGNNCGSADVGSGGGA
jgi:hypothetical protein